jgi:hypothetical protein
MAMTKQHQQQCRAWRHMLLAVATPATAPQAEAWGLSPQQLQEVAALAGLLPSLQDAAGQAGSASAARQMGTLSMYLC